MNPKISIIIPSYNSSLFIERTIESVLCQTFTDWELLIIDDCSKDNTIKILEEMTKKDPRIKTFKTPSNSGGPAYPKNIGIENAKGEYVAFLDHDDEWVPEKLERQLKIFEKSKEENLGLVYSYLYIRDNNHNLISKHNIGHRGNVLKNLSDGNFILTSSCVMTKLSILKEMGGFDLEFKTSDDIDMWIKISESGYTFDFIPEYLMNYIEHGNNVYLGNKNHENKNDYLLFYIKHKDLLLKYNLKAVGNYYYNIKDFNKARKYYLKCLISRKSSFNQKIKSIAYIIISFFPFLEKYFRNTFSSIKKITGA